MIHAILVSTLLSLPLAPPPQELEQQPIHVLSLDSVRLETFIPQHVDAEELYQVARKTVGRDVFLAERGGEYGPPASNLALMTNRILIYDDPTTVDLILASLRKLDQPDATTRTTQALIAREYAPRYITLESAVSALASYDNRGTINSQLGGVPRNIALLAERNVLVLRDTQARVTEMSALLSSLDRPEPQVILTCYVVRGGVAGVPKGLPPDLVKNLEALVPQFQFTSVGFGLVRTSVSPGRELGLRIEAETAAFELTMFPVAFDPTSGSLTVQRCRLERLPAPVVPQGEGTQRQNASRVQIFSTNAVLRGGEYTVLGASGSDPLFLVLHLTQAP